MNELGAVRRCIALDLMGLGYSEVSEDQDLSFPAQARMVLEFLDALSVREFDLVGNDSGGAIAQLVAVRAPARLNSLVLTNCDVHDNWPPPAFAQTVQLANAGLLGLLCCELLENLQLARSDLGLGVGFEHPSTISEQLVHSYIRPITRNEKRRRQLNRYVASMDCKQTVMIRGQLESLIVPTLVVWGMEDVFFPPRWADWLRQTIPGVETVVKLPGARLFLCEERAAEVAEHARDFWNANSTVE